MDNEFLIEASLVEVVDKEWAKDSLPTDDILGSIHTTNFVHFCMNFILYFHYSFSS